MCCITIVIICLNEKDRILKTLTSALGQDYRNKEIIVIDGGSTDGTVEILKDYQSSIDCFISELDNGIYHAMNKGIMLANGEYIHFLNGGDEYYNNYVLSDLFTKNNIVEDIIYGNVAYVYSNGRASIVNQPGRIGYLYLTNNSVNHQSILFRASLFKNIGNYTEKYIISGDYEFLIRSILKIKCSTKYIPIVIASYYKDGISSIGPTKDVMRMERLSIQRDHFPAPFYWFTKLRYFLLSRKNVLPHWIIKYGNNVFRAIFKPKEL